MKKSKAPIIPIHEIRYLDLNDGSMRSNYLKWGMRHSWRLAAIIVILALVLSLVGCSSSGKQIGYIKLMPPQKESMMFYQSSNNGDESYDVFYKGERSAYLYKDTLHVIDTMGTIRAIFEVMKQNHEYQQQKLNEKNSTSNSSSSYSSL